MPLPGQGAACTQCHGTCPCTQASSAPTRRAGLQVHPWPRGTSANFRPQPHYNFPLVRHPPLPTISRSDLPPHPFSHGASSGVAFDRENPSLPLGQPLAPQRPCAALSDLASAHAALSKCSFPRADGQRHVCVWGDGGSARGAGGEGGGERGLITGRGARGAFSRAGTPSSILHFPGSQERLHSSGATHSHALPARLCHAWAPGPQGR